MRVITSAAGVAAISIALLVSAGCDQAGFDYDGYAPDTFGDLGGDFMDTIPPDTPAESGDTPVEATGSSIVGDPCHAAGECGGVPGSAKVCLTELGGYINFEGGYCSAECASAVDCGTGNACVNVIDLGFYCLQLCGSSDDCRVSEGYDCRTIDTSSGLYCLPPMGGADY